MNEIIENGWKLEARSLKLKRMNDSKNEIYSPYPFGFAVFPNEGKTFVQNPAKNSDGATTERSPRLRGDADRQWCMKKS